jgi:glycosyltransferase involved in cell wall biosynthesis
MYHFVKFKTPVNYNKLPEIFAKADLLTLPNDFDERSVSFLKFSMPTKASEYMASGTPILAYSSMETAVAKHALQNKWAYVVFEQNIEKLRAAIYEIYENRDLRYKLADVAKKYAIEHYDSDKLRAEFKNSFVFIKSAADIKEKNYNESLYK